MHGRNALNYAFEIMTEIWIPKKNDSNNGYRNYSNHTTAETILVLSEHWSHWNRCVCLTKLFRKDIHQRLSKRSALKFMFCVAVFHCLLKFVCVFPFSGRTNSKRWLPVVSAQCDNSWWLYSRITSHWKCKFNWIENTSLFNARFVGIIKRLDCTRPRPLARYTIVLSKWKCSFCFLEITELN